MTYAGVWKRTAAAVIDGVIIVLGLPLSGFVLFVMGVISGEGDGLNLTSIVLTIVLLWAYFAVMESSSTQGTLGKMALGIGVTDLKGNRISLRRASGRFFCKYLSAMGLLGFVMVAFTEKEQALHDLVAGCLVVNKNKASKGARRRRRADSLGEPV
jgi:uncharacterized RDD family membrane protein YckC